jgi:hypothetical protein
VLFGVVCRTAELEEDLRALERDVQSLKHETEQDLMRDKMREKAYGADAAATPPSEDSDTDSKAAAVRALAAAASASVSPSASASTPASASTSSPSRARAPVLVRLGSGGSSPITSSASGSGSIALPARAAALIKFRPSSASAAASAPRRSSLSHLPLPVGSGASSSAPASGASSPTDSDAEAVSGGGGGVAGEVEGAQSHPPASAAAPPHHHHQHHLHHKSDEPLRRPYSSTSSSPIQSASHSPARSPRHGSAGSGSPNAGSRPTHITLTPALIISSPEPLAAAGSSGGAVPPSAADNKAAADSSTALAPAAPAPAPTVIITPAPPASSVSGSGVEGVPSSVAPTIAPAPQPLPAIDPDRIKPPLMGGDGHSRRSSISFAASAASGVAAPAPAPAASNEDKKHDNTNATSTSSTASTSSNTTASNETAPTPDYAPRKPLVRQEPVFPRRSALWSPPPKPPLCTLRRFVLLSMLCIFATFSAIFVVPRLFPAVIPFYQRTYVRYVLPQWTRAYREHIAPVQERLCERYCMNWVYTSSAKGMGAMSGAMSGGPGGVTRPTQLQALLDSCHDNLSTAEKSNRELTARLNNLTATLNATNASAKSGFAPIVNDTCSVQLALSQTQLSQVNATAHALRASLEQCMSHSSNELLLTSIQNLTARVSETQRNLTLCSVALTSAQAKSEESHGALLLSQTQVQELTTSLTALNKSLSATNSSLTACQSASAQLTTQLTNSSAQLTALSANATACHSALHTTQSQLNSSAADVQALRAELQTASESGERCDTELTRCTSQQLLLESDLNECQSSALELTHQLSQCRTAHSDEGQCEAALSTATAQLADATAQLLHLNSTLLNTTKALAEAQRNTSECESAAKSTATTLNAQLTNCTQRLNETQSAGAECVAALVLAQLNVTALSEQVSALKSAAATAQQQKAAADPEEDAELQSGCIDALAKCVLNSTDLRSRLTQATAALEECTSHSTAAPATTTEEGAGSGESLLMQCMNELKDSEAVVATYQEQLKQSEVALTTAQSAAQKAAAECQTVVTEAQRNTSQCVVSLEAAQRNASDCREALDAAEASAVEAAKQIAAVTASASTTAPAPASANNSTCDCAALRAELVSAQNNSSLCQAHVTALDAVYNECDAALTACVNHTSELQATVQNVTAELSAAVAAQSEVERLSAGLEAAHLNFTKLYVHFSHLFESVVCAIFFLICDTLCCDRSEELTACRAGASNTTTTLSNSTSAAADNTTRSAEADEGCAARLERAQHLHEQELSGCQRQLQQSTDALDLVEQALVAVVATTTSSTSTAPARSTNTSFPSYGAVPSATSDSSSDTEAAALEYFAAVNGRLTQLQALTEQVHAQWLNTLDPVSAFVQWVQSLAVRSPVGNSWWDVLVPAGPRPSATGAAGSAVNTTASKAESEIEADESPLPLEVAQLLPPWKWLRTLPVQSVVDDMCVVTRSCFFCCGYT